MLIGKKYKISSDSLNITLYRKVRMHKKDTGKPYDHWEAIGYYSSVENALKGLVDRGVGDTGLKDLKTIIAKIDGLHKLIETATRTPVANNTTPEGVKGYIDEVGKRARRK
jgi:hypothetical protein